MREFRSYGSVRGAPSNGRPYRKGPPMAAYEKGDRQERVYCVEKLIRGRLRGIEQKTDLSERPTIDDRRSVDGSTTP